MSHEWEAIVPDYKGYVVKTAFCPDCGQQIMADSLGWSCFCSEWTFERIDDQKVIKRRKLGDNDGRKRSAE